MAIFKKALYQLLGERIRKKRVEMGYSQDSLAKVLGIGRASISNIEAGKHQIPLSTLYQLSNKLNTEIHLILPTYSEIIEKMNMTEFSDIKSVLEKQSLNKKTISEIEDLIKKL